MKSWIFKRINWPHVEPKAAESILWEFESSTTPKESRWPCQNKTSWPTTSFLPGIVVNKKVLVKFHGSVFQTFLLLDFLTTSFFRPFDLGNFFLGEQFCADERSLSLQILSRPAIFCFFRRGWDVLSWVFGCGGWTKKHIRRDKKVTEVLVDFSSGERSGGKFWVRVLRNARMKKPILGPMGFLWMWGDWWQPKWSNFHTRLWWNAGGFIED